jgi:hypothetical protein
MGLALGSALLQAVRVCVVRPRAAAAEAAPPSGRLSPIAPGSELLLEQNRSSSLAEQRAEEEGPSTSTQVLLEISFLIENNLTGKQLY